MALVDVQKLAQALNVTPARISQLVAEGLPKEARGRYDLGQCMLWYIRYLQARLRRKATANDDGRDSSISEERKRLLKAQADREELELQRARAELIPVQLHEDEMIGAFTVVRQRLLALPVRLAPRLEGESRAVIKVKLNEAVREALVALSKTKRNVRSSGGTSTRNDSAAAPGLG